MDTLGHMHKTTEKTITEADSRKNSLKATPSHGENNFFLLQ